MSLRIEFPTPKKVFWRPLPPRESHRIAGTSLLFYRASELLNATAKISELGISCKKLSVDLFLHFFGNPTIMYFISEEQILPGWFPAFTEEDRKFIITDGKTTIVWLFELADGELFTLYDYYDNWSTGWRSHDIIAGEEGIKRIKMRTEPDIVKVMQDLIIALLEDLVFKCLEKTTGVVGKDGLRKCKD